MVARVRSFTSPKFEDELLAEVAGMGWRITRWLHGDFFLWGSSEDRRKVALNLGEEKG